ncbi:MAG: pyridine nucleotide-disulfide oxidoreductase, partial [Deltaproteobacteria bacterium HGW-Deltaproteobacteria-24]
CINGCTHMQTFNISPNAYVRQINHNERIILGTHYANKMINSCTQCGLCKEACFLDISMKDVIHETRESMVEKGKMPLSAHDFALKDMKFSNSKKFSMVRKQPSKEASKDLFYYPVLSYSKYAKGLFRGSGKTGFLFYPGCQLSATHSEHIGEIYKYLVGTMKENYIEGDVGLYLGCCGAPADWAGRQDLMGENTQNIKKVWEENDQPTFILACSSCISIFEKYLPEIEVVSLWEIFDQYGLPQRNIKPGRRVLNIHDACATRHHSNVHKSIRNIVNSLSYKIVELDYTKDKTKCCGYGGLVYYANRDQATEFIKDRINESSEDLLVYCAMCKDLFVSGGKRTLHILDLIYGTNLDGLANKKMPTLSERHYNRTKLKMNLLNDIWGEKQGMDMMNHVDFNLIIPDDIMAIMED